MSGPPPEAEAPAPEPAPAPAPTSEPEPAPGGRSRGLVLFGLLLACGGVVWLLASLGVFDVSPVTWLGALLVLVGAVLVGVPRGGHVGVLVALGIVLALAGSAASTIETSLLSGGIGDRDEQPRSVAELEDYELGIGTLRIDLTELADTFAPVSVRASIGIGELVVIVPANAELEVSASLSAGEIVVREEQEDGTDVDLDETFPGAGGPLFLLDLEGSLGSIRVEDDFGF